MSIDIKCNRNDKIEKVSALVASQTHNLQGTTRQTTDYREQDGRWHSTTSTVPFSGTQITELARRLSPPSKPELDASWKIIIGKVFLWIGVIGMIPGVILFILIISPTVEYNLYCHWQGNDKVRRRRTSSRKTQFRIKNTKMGKGDAKVESSLLLLA